MYNKGKSTLTSIPERNEIEEENITKKWVSKKKHEVLKAKYKCLKKLFQIYDASVIGILPEGYSGNVESFCTEDDKKRRKRRSHRTKTDACAGTTESSSGDVTRTSLEKPSTIATTVLLNDLKHSSSDLDQKSKSTLSKTYDKYAATQDSKDNISNTTVRTVRECDYAQTSSPVLNHSVPNHPVPYLMLNEKRKPTRFQCFLHRIFGIRRDWPYKNYVFPNGHVFAASDNNICHHYAEKRRRRGLRIRRLRRPKKVHSEITLGNVNSPVILTYVQSVQRNCLLDTTPRQCPIMGCRMIFYGIINYNDHLNLCHFTERKFICHYCHEGFEREYEKIVHENEHIGINKIGPHLNSTLTSNRDSGKKVIDTQTETGFIKCNVPEEKLKKIVSFFDKIADSEQLLSEIKKNVYSESNLRASKAETLSEIEENSTNNSSTDSEKRTLSCYNLCEKKFDKINSSAVSDLTSNSPFGSPVKCHLCGENFEHRRQLSLHVDLEHRVHDKFSKFHSCTGISNVRDRKHLDLIAGEGHLKLRSIGKVHSREGDPRFALKNEVRAETPSILTQDSYSDITRRKSDETVSCDPSTNIVYYTSMETVSKKPSIVDNLVQKVRSGLHYRWEPGTKIIRV